MHCIRLQAGKALTYFLLPRSFFFFLSKAITKLFPFLVSNSHDAVYRVWALRWDRLQSCSVFGHSVSIPSTKSSCLRVGATTLCPASSLFLDPQKEILEHELMRERFGANVSLIFSWYKTSRLLILTGCYEVPWNDGGKSCRGPPPSSAPRRHYVITSFLKYVMLRCKAVCRSRQTAAGRHDFSLTFFFFSFITKKIEA